MKKNKPTGFWIKFITRITDLVIISVIIVVIAFSLMKHTGDKWAFDKPWTFYLWAIISMIIISINFILIPFLTKGRTPAMFITRIKIENNKYGLLRSIIKREQLFAIVWLVNLLLLMIVINHTLINSYAETKDKDAFNYWWNHNLTGWEKVRIELVTTIGTMTIVVQMLFAISSLVRKDKKSLADVIADTTIVWINKFIHVEKNQNNNKTPKPEMFKNNIVNWV